MSVRKRIFTYFQSPFPLNIYHLERVEKLSALHCFPVVPPRHFLGYFPLHDLFTCSRKNVLSIWPCQVYIKCILSPWWMTAFIHGPHSFLKNRSLLSPKSLIPSFLDSLKFLCLMSVDSLMYGCLYWVNILKNNLKINNTFVITI